jgi:eukaryotic-like serine/threonine-protein kinase
MQAKETAEIAPGAGDRQQNDSSTDELVEQLFHEALGQPRESRLRWLADRCRGAQAVQREVESLLEASGEAERFLETPPSDAVEIAREAKGAGTLGALDIDRTLAESLVGRTVGDFTLDGVLGQGGMGVVYRATQRQPRRTVALKLVRPGLASASSMRRLELEAEALGRVRHPGIAAIHAAGTADLGMGPQPFVAMEFVEGWPLRAWLAGSKPDLVTKVRTLRAVAEAIQHAHQNGIIHRDLKPDNLLVEESPQGPRPRVLDFGVARLTQRNAAGEGTAAMTVEGHLVGTLAYMSPEQVRGQEVDTRSDIYALGLIAWEMIAERPARSFLEGSLADAVRAALDRPPPPLTTVVADCPIDLSLVVSKALEPDASRRYATADAFAADLARFLRHEPVTARAPTAAYLLFRYARRHRAQVAAACATLATLIVAFGLVTGLLLRTRAAEERERQRADDSSAVVDAMLWSLGLDAQVPTIGPVDIARLREMLTALEADGRRRLADRPQAEARLLNAIAERHHTLNDYAKAKELFERSLERSDAGGGDARVLRASALHGLAAAEFFLAQGDAVRLGPVAERYEQALAARRSALGGEHSDTALTMRHLAAVRRALGDLGEAERLYRDSLAIHERLHAAGDPLATPVMVASGLNGLAAFLSGRDEHVEAQTLLERSLRMLRSMPDNERRAVDEARVLRNLGTEEGFNRHFDDGLASLDEAEAIFVQQLGPTNREVATTLLRRAKLELRRGNQEGARSAAERILASFDLTEQDALRVEAERIRVAPPPP